MRRLADFSLILGHYDAAYSVYDHKGLENFDENLYTLVTDAENYKDEYYNDSLIIMSSMLRSSIWVGFDVRCGSLGPSWVGISKGR